jgi:bloom syndrome protein
MSDFPEFVRCSRDAMMEAAKEMNISLKEKQEEAIAAFVGGRDTFVSLPTGYGKSIIYGILPVMYNILLGECLLCYFHHVEG